MNIKLPLDKALVVLVCGGICMANWYMPPSGNMLEFCVVLMITMCKLSFIGLRTLFDLLFHRVNHPTWGGWENTYAFKKRHIHKTRFFFTSLASIVGLVFFIWIIVDLRTATAYTTIDETDVSL